MELVGPIAPSLQSDNLSDEVKAQNVTAGNALEHFYGLSADLVGRITGPNRES